MENYSKPIIAGACLILPVFWVKKCQEPHLQTNKHQTNPILAPLKRWKSHALIDKRNTSKHTKNATQKNIEMQKNKHEHNYQYISYPVF